MKKIFSIAALAMTMLFSNSLTNKAMAQKVTFEGTKYETSYKQDDKQGLLIKVGLNVTDCPEGTELDVIAYLNKGDKGEYGPLDEGPSPEYRTAKGVVSTRTHIKTKHKGTNYWRLGGDNCVKLFLPWEAVPGRQGTYHYSYDIYVYNPATKKNELISQANKLTLVWGSKPLPEHYASAPAKPNNNNGQAAAPATPARPTVPARPLKPTKPQQAEQQANTQTEQQAAPTRPELSFGEVGHQLKNNVHTFISPAQQATIDGKKMMISYELQVANEDKKAIPTIVITYQGAAADIKQLASHLNADSESSNKLIQMTLDSGEILTANGRAYCENGTTLRIEVSLSAMRSSHKPISAKKSDYRYLATQLCTHNIAVLTCNGYGMTLSAASANLYADLFTIMKRTTGNTYCQPSVKVNPRVQTVEY